MESRHMMRQLPRFAEPKCICRLFSTHLPRLQPAPPPSPPSFPPPSNRDTPSSTTYTPSRKAPTPYSSPRSALNARSNRSANNPDAFTLASTLAAEASLRTDLDRVSQYDRKRADMEELEKSGRGRDLEKFMVRKWKPGDVYAPHDLSSVEMGKWGKRRAAERDVFDMLGINPLNEYKNFAMMAEYMTPMGRIRHRRDTGLRAVNQRKIAKAIRRAVGMALIPSVHKHPEMLEVEAKTRNMKKYLKDLEGRRPRGYGA